MLLHLNPVAFQQSKSCQLLFMKKQQLCAIFYHLLASQILFFYQDLVLDGHSPIDLSGLIFIREGDKTVHYAGLTCMIWLLCSHHVLARLYCSKGLLFFQSSSRKRCFSPFALLYFLVVVGGDAFLVGCCCRRIVVHLVVASATTTANQKLKATQIDRRDDYFNHSYSFIFFVWSVRFTTSCWYIIILIKVYLFLLSSYNNMIYRLS